MQIADNSDLDPGPGPTPQTGTSSSQPLTTEALRLLSKYRRTASDRAKERAYAAGTIQGQLVWYSLTVGLPDKQFLTVEQLRKAVFKVIVERLKANQVPVDRLSEATLSWCLPTKYVAHDRWRSYVNKR
jgi:hypothetical protein